MRAAMAAAEVGDEQEREDPTVLELERRAAVLLGHDDAIFLPTATLANIIALRLLSQPGDELLAEATSHVLIYELGGPAVHAGLVTRALPGSDGRIIPEQIRAAVRPPGMHFPPTALVSIENTHNSSGGRVWPLEEIRAVAATCRELDLRLHLDGARLLNASVALGVPAAELGCEADAVTLCLSKGLGCPLGAVLAGSADLVERGRRLKHLFGGALRQAGIVAAAGLHALDNHVERLADDHANARCLAAGLAGAGLAVDPDSVETNFVHIEVGPDRAAALARLREHGVRLSETVHPTVVRAVIHLDVSAEDIDEAIERIPRALETRVRA